MANQVTNKAIYLDTSGTVTLPTPETKIIDIIVATTGASPSLQLVVAGIPIFGCRLTNGTTERYRFGYYPILVQSPITVVLNKVEAYMRLI